MRSDQVLSEYQARLMKRDANQQQEYTRRWIRVEDALKPAATAFALDLIDRRKRGETIAPESIYAMASFLALVAMFQQQGLRYAADAAKTIATDQWYGEQTGIEGGVDTIRAVAEDERQEPQQFPILAASDLNFRSGLLGDGSPVTSALSMAIGAAIAAMVMLLAETIGRTTDVRKIEEAILGALAGVLQQTLSISRTEMMRAYREAIVAQYRASGVVVAYRRRAAFRPTTCIACIMQDGRIYQMHEQFSDHPNGFCTCSPILVTGERVPALTGRNWFMSLPAFRQKEIMGRKFFEAWKRGDFDLDQISHMHHDPIWGESPRITPLKDLRRPV